MCQGRQSSKSGVFLSLTHHVLRQCFSLHLELVSLAGLQATKPQGASYLKLLSAEVVSTRQAFNRGQGSVCGPGYLTGSTLRARPLPSLQVSRLIFPPLYWHLTLIHSNSISFLFHWTLDAATPWQIQNHLVFSCVVF